MNPINPDTTKLEDDFDDLVRRACDGDRRALGAICIAMSGALLAEVRAALGDRAPEAGDLLCDFFNGVAEGRVRFAREDGHAVAWMRRVLGEMAACRRAEHARARASSATEVSP
jgi:hypothetical protein